MNALTSLITLRDAVLAREIAMPTLHRLLGPSRPSSADWRLDCDTRELPFKDAHIELRDGRGSGAVAYLRRPIETSWPALTTLLGSHREVGPACDDWGGPISHCFSCRESPSAVRGTLILQVKYRHPDELPTDAIHVEAIVVRRLE